MKYELFLQYDRWGFDEKGWADSTRRAYVKRAEAANSWLLANRGKTIQMAKPKDLKAYLFSTVPHARNRNNIRQALIGLGMFMEEKGYWEYNYGHVLSRLREPQSVPWALSPAQARDVVRASKALGAMTEALVAVLIYGGLRREEARLLEWRHVYSYEWLKFSGKGSKQRVVPLHADAGVSLQKWHHAASEPVWVFASTRRTARPICATYMRHMIYDVDDQAGIEQLHPHILRHTAATRLLECGADIRTLQEFLGHADVSTTALHAHVRPARLKDAIGKMSYVEEVATSKT